MPFLRQTLRELRPTLALALPIMMGQVGQMLMGIADSAMIGHVGNVPLAASAFAGSVFGVFFIAGTGLLVPVSVLVARAHGESRPAECAEWVRHGLLVGLVCGVGEALLMAALATQLHRFGQPPEVVREANPFFVIIAVSLVPALAFQVLRQSSDALGRPWPPMFILLGAVGVNVLLNWVLIYGHLGAPALGLTGAGWATLISRCCSVAAIWWWLGRQPGLRDLRPGRDGRAGIFSRHSLAHLREILRLGIPGAGQLIFEAGAFYAAALMMGWLGTVPLAAHQIALSCAALSFMFPLGISLAAGLRISKARGEGRLAAIRPIGFGALGAGVTIMGLFAVLFAAGGGLIARGFTADIDVAALAARLLLVAAIFQMFDGAQVIGAGALRGLTDVRVPTLITFFAYWMVALPAGGLLGFSARLGPIGIWSGLAAGLACAAVLLAWRFHRHTAPGDAT